MPRASPLAAALALALLLVRPAVAQPDALYTPVNVTCLSGSHRLDPRHGVCFALRSVSLTWAAGREACRTSFNGTLAAIRGADTDRASLSSLPALPTRAHLAFAYVNDSAPWAQLGALANERVPAFEYSLRSAGLWVAAGSSLATDALVAAPMALSNSTSPLWRDGDPVSIGGTGAEQFTTTYAQHNTFSTSPRVVQALPPQSINALCEYPAVLGWQRNVTAVRNSPPAWVLPPADVPGTYLSPATTTGAPIFIAAVSVRSPTAALNASGAVWPALRLFATDADPSYHLAGRVSYSLVLDTPELRAAAAALGTPQHIVPAPDGGGATQLLLHAEARTGRGAYDVATPPYATLTVNSTLLPVVPWALSADNATWDVISAIVPRQQAPSVATVDVPSLPLRIDCLRGWLVWRSDLAAWAAANVPIPANATNATVSGLLRIRAMDGMNATASQDVLVAVAITRYADAAFPPPAVVNADAAVGPVLAAAGQPYSMPIAPQAVCPPGWRLPAAFGRSLDPGVTGTASAQTVGTNMSYIPGSRRHRICFRVAWEAGLYGASTTGAASACFRAFGSGAAPGNVNDDAELVAAKLALQDAVAAAPGNGTGTCPACGASAWLGWTPLNNGWAVALDPTVAYTTTASSTMRLSVVPLTTNLAFALMDPLMGADRLTGRWGAGYPNAYRTTGYQPIDRGVVLSTVNGSAGLLYTASDVQTTTRWQSTAVIGALCEMRALELPITTLAVNAAPTWAMPPTAATPLRLHATNEYADEAPFYRFLAADPDPSWLPAGMVRGYYVVGGNTSDATSLQTASVNIGCDGTVALDSLTGVMSLQLPASFRAGATLPPPCTFRVVATDGLNATTAAAVTVVLTFGVSTYTIYPTGATSLDPAAVRPVGRASAPLLGFVNGCGCTSGWVLSNDTCTCFRTFRATVRTWSAAKAHCESLAPGGTLGSIRSLLEYYASVAAMSAASFPPSTVSWQVWMGMNVPPTQPSTSRACCWTFTSGANTSFIMSSLGQSIWSAGEPNNFQRAGLNANETCVSYIARVNAVLNVNVGLNDQLCDIEYPYMCEVPAETWNVARYGPPPATPPVAVVNSPPRWDAVDLGIAWRWFDAGAADIALPDGVYVGGTRFDDGSTASLASLPTATLVASGGIIVRTVPDAAEVGDVVISLAASDPDASVIATTAAPFTDISVRRIVYGVVVEGVRATAVEQGIAVAQGDLPALPTPPFVINVGNGDPAGTALPPWPATPSVPLCGGRLSLNPLTGAITVARSLRETTAENATDCGSVRLALADGAGAVSPAAWTLNVTILRRTVATAAVVCPAATIIAQGSGAATALSWPRVDGGATAVTWQATWFAPPLVGVGSPLGTARCYAFVPGNLTAVAAAVDCNVTGTCSQRLADGACAAVFGNARAATFETAAEVERFAAATTGRTAAVERATAAGAALYRGADGGSFWLANSGFGAGEAQQQLVAQPRRGEPRDCIVLVGGATLIGLPCRPSSGGVAAPVLDVGGDQRAQRLWRGVVCERPPAGQSRVIRRIASPLAWDATRWAASAAPTGIATAPPHVEPYNLPVSSGITWSSPLLFEVPVNNPAGEAALLPESSLAYALDLTAAATSVTMATSTVALPLYDTGVATAAAARSQLPLRLNATLSTVSNSALNPSMQALIGGMLSPAPLAPFAQPALLAARPAQMQAVVAAEVSTLLAFARSTLSGQAAMTYSIGTTLTRLEPVVGADVTFNLTRRDGAGLPRVRYRFFAANLPLAPAPAAGERSRFHCAAGWSLVTDDNGDAPAFPPRCVSLQTAALRSAADAVATCAALSPVPPTAALSGAGVIASTVLGLWPPPDSAATHARFLRAVLAALSAANEAAGATSWQPRWAAYGGTVVAFVRAAACAAVTAGNPPSLGWLPPTIAARATLTVPPVSCLSPPPGALTTLLPLPFVINAPTAAAAADYAAVRSNASMVAQCAVLVALPDGSAALHPAACNVSRPVLCESPPLMRPGSFPRFRYPPRWLGATAVAIRDNATFVVTAAWGAATDGGVISELAVLADAGGDLALQLTPARASVTTPQGDVWVPLCDPVATPHSAASGAPLPLWLSLRSGRVLTNGSWPRVPRAMLQWANLTALLSGGCTVTVTASDTAGQTNPLPLQLRVNITGAVSLTTLLEPDPTGGTATTASLVSADPTTNATITVILAAPLCRSSTLTQLGVDARATAADLRDRYSVAAALAAVAASPPLPVSPPIRTLIVTDSAPPATISLLLSVPPADGEQVRVFCYAAAAIAASAARNSGCGRLRITPPSCTVTAATPVLSLHFAVEAAISFGTWRSADDAAAGSSAALPPQLQHACRIQCNVTSVAATAAAAPSPLPPPRYRSLPPLIVPTIIVNSRWPLFADAVTTLGDGRLRSALAPLGYSPLNASNLPPLAAAAALSPDAGGGIASAADLPRGISGWHPYLGVTLSTAANVTLVAADAVWRDAAWPGSVDVQRSPWLETVVSWWNGSGAAVAGDRLVAMALPGEQAAWAANAGAAGTATAVARPYYGRVTSPTFAAACGAASLPPGTACAPLRLQLAPTAAIASAQVATLTALAPLCAQSQLEPWLVSFVVTVPLAPTVACPPLCPGRLLAAMGRTPFNTSTTNGSLPAVAGDTALFLSDLLSAYPPATAVSTTAGSGDVTEGVRYVEKCVDPRYEDPTTGVCADASNPARTRCAFGGGDACVPCPSEAGLCPGGYAFRPFPGYFTASDATIAGVARCATPATERCLGWSDALGAVQCGVGYKQGSPGCSACDVGYYARAGVCAACPSTNGDSSLVLVLRSVGLFIAGLTGVGALAFTVVYVAQRSRGGTIAGGLKRALQFVVATVGVLQTVAQVGRSSPPSVPSFIRRVYAAVAFVQFDGVSLPSPCLGPAYLFRQEELGFYVVLALLGVWAAVQSGCSTVAWCCGRRPRARQPANTPFAPISRVAVTLLGLLYALTANNALAIARCRATTMLVRDYVSLVGDGATLRAAGILAPGLPVSAVPLDVLDRSLSVSVVAAYPDVVCMEGRHTAVFTLALVVLAVYTLGWPIISLLWVSGRMRTWLALQPQLLPAPKPVDAAVSTAHSDREAVAAASPGWCGSCRRRRDTAALSATPAAASVAIDIAPVPVHTAPPAEVVIGGANPMLAGPRGQRKSVAVRRASHTAAAVAAAPAKATPEGGTSEADAQRGAVRVSAGALAAAMSFGPAAKTRQMAATMHAAAAPPSASAPPAVLTTSSASVGPAATVARPSLSGTPPATTEHRDTDDAMCRACSRGERPPLLPSKIAGDVAPPPSHAACCARWPSALAANTHPSIATDADIAPFVASEFRPAVFWLKHLDYAGLVVLAVLAAFSQALLASGGVGTSALSLGHLVIFLVTIAQLTFTLALLVALQPYRIDYRFHYHVNLVTLLLSIVAAALTLTVAITLGGTTDRTLGDEELPPAVTALAYIMLVLSAGLVITLAVAFLAQLFDGARSEQVVVERKAAEARAARRSMTRPSLLTSATAAAAAPATSTIPAGEGGHDALPLRSNPLFSSAPLAISPRVVARASIMASRAADAGSPGTSPVSPLAAGDRLGTTTSTRMSGGGGDGDSDEEDAGGASLRSPNSRTAASMRRTSTVDGGERIGFRVMSSRNRLPTPSSRSGRLVGAATAVMSARAMAAASPARSTSGRRLLGAGGGSSRRLLTSTAGVGDGTGVVSTVSPLARARSGSGSSRLLSAGSSRRLLSATAAAGDAVQSPMSAGGGEPDVTSPAAAPRRPSGGRLSLLTSPAGPSPPERRGSLRPSQTAAAAVQPEASTSWWSRLGRGFGAR